MKKKQCLSLLLIFALLLSCGAPALADAPSDDLIRSMIVISIGTSLDQYEHTVTVLNGTAVLKISPGLPDSVMQMARSSPDIMSAWENVRSSYIGLSNSGSSLLKSLGAENGAFIIIITDRPSDPGGEVYLMVVNGTILQDFLY